MRVLKNGDHIDQFLIEGLVARGGMASIFRATDIESGSPVALKVPHPESEADVVYFDRFQREQAICREMNHPGVIRAIDPERRSRVYLAMEWAEGRSLRRLLEETPRFDPERAVRIAISVCNALDHIHTHGVVHRDLKPENIMVDASDQVKLIDFGIAAKAGARRLTFGRLSRIMGTPDYISPEQVRGKRGGAQTDIYSLGVILYEMLAGHTPFEGENPFLVMNDRLHNSPPPLRDEVPNLPPGLDKVIAKALERDPRKRYASALELSLDLADPASALFSADPVFESNRKIPVLPFLVVVPPAILALLIYLAGRQ